MVGGGRGQRVLIMATFGELLRGYRLKAGLSQEALAERASLSTDGIRALERGRRGAPRAETVALLVEALALAPSERTSLIAAAGAAARQQDVPAQHVPATPDPPRYSVLLAPPTRLIGREQEMRAVTDLLRGGARLVTLLGPGGVGKTHLALVLAATLGEDYSGGVAVVELAALRDPALMAVTIAQALGLRETGAQSARELLLEYLRPRHMLLVLDNLEQVVEEAPLLAELVAMCPLLVILATSRIALRLSAEQQFRVPPLTVPSLTYAVKDELASIPAVELFVERVHAVQPDYVLADVDAGAVATICRRLDGLPLAIELAAARVRLLPPPALLSRLESRLAILTGGARDLPARQQTLRATLEWSAALLPSWEQALFRRLSVCVGGCTLDAAEALATLGGVEDGDVLAGLGGLVEHSLLRAGQGEGAESTSQPRFAMLETIREYGLERLAASNEEVQVRRVHALYYLALAEEAAGHLFAADQVRWLELLEREHDNLREALRGARATGDAALGLRLTVALWSFWYIRCHLSEGRRWLQEFVAMAAGPDAAPVRAEALVGLAVISYAQTDYAQADTAAAEAMSYALAPGASLAIVLNIRGGVARCRSDFARASALGEECVALTRSLGDPWGLVLSLHNLADVARLQGDLTRAVALAEESVALTRTLGDRWSAAQALLTRGLVARDRGDIDEAETFFLESLEIVRALGHTRDIALALAGLGYVARSRHDLARAQALFEESLSLLRPLGDKLRVADVLTALGDVRRALGGEQACDLYRESLFLCQAVGSKLGIAANLEGLATLAWHTTGHAESAARLLAAATTLRETMGAPLTQSEHLAIDQEKAAIHAALGDGFAAAWEAGCRFALDRAIAEASFPV